MTGLLVSLLLLAGGGEQPEPTPPPSPCVIHSCPKPKPNICIRNPVICYPVMW